MKERAIHSALEAEAEVLVAGRVDLWPEIVRRLGSRAPIRSCQRGRLSVRRVVAAAGVLVAVVATAWMLARQATPVSAGEILRRAGSAWAAQAEGADIVMQRFSIGTQTEDGADAGLMAEIWQSADGSQMRYQVVDDEGRIVFLVLRSGEEIWRSLHHDPPGETPIEAVLHTSTEQLAFLLPRGGGSSPLFRSVFYGLADLDSLLVQGREACPDLLCLLGVLDLDDGHVRILGRERTDEGREVYVIGILDLPGARPSWDDARLVRLDSQSYALLEYTDIQGNSLRLVERRGLAGSSIPNGFFRLVPGALRVVEVPETWRPPTSPEAARGDRVWIVSVDPEPLTALMGAERFVVTVGYELVSAPLADLYASLMPACLLDAAAGCGGGISGAGRVIVAAGTGAASVEFVLEPWNLQGEQALAAYLDTGSPVDLFSEYRWPSALP